MNRHRAGVAAAFAASLALAACSSGHADNPALSAPPSVPFTATASNTAPAPCDLVSVAQVKTAFGGIVTPSEHPTPADRPECDWAISGSNLGSDIRLALYYPPVQTSAAFHAAKTGLPGAVGIPELGTDAYYLPDQYALTVLVGTDQFTIQARFPTGSSAKPDAGDVQLDLINVARYADAAY